MSNPLVTTAGITLKDLGGGVWGSMLQLANRRTAIAGAAIQFDTHETDVDLFRSKLYVWDFGDVSSGNWQDGKPKNSDTGPIAGHVYEAAGTYAVSCKIYDATGLISTLNDSVVITDPDTVYAGTLTTCISTGADFTGAPAGAAQVTLTDLALIDTYIGTGKRLLFKRGDTWTGDGALVFNTYTDLSDVYIGAFGTGTSPDALGHFTNDPQIDLTGTSAESLFFLRRPQRWVISHLTVTGPDTIHDWTYGVDQMIDVTYLRCKTTGFQVPMGGTHLDISGHEGMAYVECRISDGKLINLFIGSEQLLILGGVFKDSEDSHTIRVWECYRGAFRHNDTSGSSLVSDTGRQLLKFHGASEDLINPTGPWTGSELKHRTEFSVISDNVFGAGGPWPLTVAPVDNGKDCRIQGVILEGNRYIGDYGLNSSQLVGIPVYMVASHCVVRNETIDTTGMKESSFTVVAILGDGVVPVRIDNHVYNNTAYLLDGATYSNGNTLFVAGTNTSGTIIKNNFVNEPASVTTPSVLISDNGVGTIASSNLLTATPLYTDVNNVNPLLRDFSVTVGSPALDAGEDVPVFIDADGNPRVSGAYDLGAYQE